MGTGGRIYREEGEGEGLWKLKAGRARDIAIGGEGTVAILGREKGKGGYQIFKHNSMEGWDHIPGRAVKIAVDSEGHIWALNHIGLIFQETSAEDRV